MGVVADYDLKLRVSRPLPQYGNAQRLQTVVDRDSLRQPNPVALRALDQRRRWEIGGQLVAECFGGCSAVGGALICG